MPAIYLLRHGQASFGTENYDVLSELGRQQAQVASQELVRRGLRSPVVISGSLQRQIDTAAIAAENLQVDLQKPDPRFDEFDAHAAVNTFLGDPLATEGMSSTEFQQHLDAVMATWMDNSHKHWQDFSDGAFEALTELAASLPKGSDAVIATSAGVTAVLAGRLLGADTQGVIAMNRVSVNASITSIVSGSRGLSLVSFNDHSYFLSDRTLFTNR
jgi:broad specificity phosphatase PhoE